MANTIMHRIFQPCAHLQNLPLNQNLSVCKCCDRYFVVCRYCAAKAPPPKVQVKAQCLAQSGPCAVAVGAVCLFEAGRAAPGIAIKRHSNNKQALVIAVQLKIDPGQIRSQQRTELLAVFYAVRSIRRSHQRLSLNPLWHSLRSQRHVLLTDSQYVMMGMTNWIPSSGVSDTKPNQARAVLTDIDSITIGEQSAVHTVSISISSGVWTMLSLPSSVIPVSRLNSPIDLEIRHVILINLLSRRLGHRWLL